MVAPIAAMLVQMAISRTREYSADRAGAEISGRPRCARLGAGEDLQRRRAHPQRRRPQRNPATAHLFIVNPLSGTRMDNLFSTHPATENRIAALMEMARRVRRPPGRPSAAADPRLQFPGSAPPAARRDRGDRACYRPGRWLNPLTR